MPNPPSSGFHALILAAGRSSRMGREKARLPWVGGKTLLSWMVDALSQAGWKTTAVLGPDSFAYWNATLPAGCAVRNPDPARGKTSSLICGVETLPPDAGWILISAVDQPRPPALYHRLRAAAAAHPAKILVPTREGSRGHPVVLTGALRHELLALEEKSQGLRGLLDSHRAETYRLTDGDAAEWQFDMNTPDAYDRALRSFQENCRFPINAQLAPSVSP